MSTDDVMDGLRRSYRDNPYPSHDEPAFDADAVMVGAMTLLTRHGDRQLCDRDIQQAVIDADKVLRAVDKFRGAAPARPDVADHCDTGGE